MCVFGKEGETEIRSCTVQSNQQHQTFVVFLIHNAPLPSPFLHPPIYRTTWYMYISVEPE